MYTNFDLLKLEELTDAQLKEQLDIARGQYTYIQSLYENDEREGIFEPKVPLNIIFMHLKNVEMYIRRIENLLNEYEIDRVFIKKAVTRRNKRFSRLK